MKKITQLLFMALLLLSSTTIAQSTIKGQIVADGLPLPGANILEKGTSNGVSTDIDGNFVLQSNATAGSIVISYVGYSSKTLKYDGAKDFGTIVRER